MLNRYFILDCKFHRHKFEGYKSTYEATENVISQMKAIPKLNIYETDRSHGEFLYNEETKTAVFLKFVINLMKTSFQKNRNKAYKNPFDCASRITTTSVGKQAATHFLNEPRFNGYDLVIPIGSHSHEACLYVQKSDTGISIIYYNPNYSAVTKGVQFNKVSRELIQLFGKKVTSIKSFYSPNGNYAGKCSVLSWEKIFSHVVDGKSPFKNGKLKLEDYTKLATGHSHEKYRNRALLEDENQSDSDTGNDNESNIDNEYHFNQFDMMKNIDDLLNEFETNDDDALTIVGKMDDAITEYFESKKKPVT